MSKKTVSAIMHILLLTSVLSSALIIQPVKAASGTIYIRANGSIDPPIAPITTVDNVTYTFTDNIYDKIVVERDNIVVDGIGYTVQGDGTGDGFFLSDRSNVTIKKASIKGFTRGIFLYNSSNDSIVENYIAANVVGIELEGCSNNSIIGNAITDNEFDGIRMLPGAYDFYSNHNTIVGNNIANSDQGICLFASLDGNISENIITANNWDGIQMNECSNNIVSENTITATNYYGIRILKSGSNVFSGNNITSNKWREGILLDISSNHNHIFGNNITENYYGISLCGSSNYNSVVRNFLINNNYGFQLDHSSNNDAFGNDIASNKKAGIYLTSSSNNTIIKNDVRDNDVGIEFYSSNNSIYHNNFVNNRLQVNLDNLGVNAWDDSYPSGGNYWSDYTGNDTYFGPYQNVSGSDGIGDIPYTIDANNRDSYPLMNHWVPIIGDVDGNGKVDMADLWTVAKAFGTLPNHERWDSECDINNDNKIDMVDLWATATNFGKIGP